MRKKLFTFLLALATSVGLSWATDPIVITTNTSQSSYTQGTITITCSKPGDSDGFYLDKNDNGTATITVSGSSTISQIELSIGWFPQNRSNVRANGAEPTSSDEYSITFTNVNSNNVTLTITDEKIQIRDVTITLADEGGSTPTPTEPAIVITTNTEQSSYTQGNITITCSKPGDSDGFYLEKSGNETATITVSGSSTISQIELGIGWYPDYRSYVRANGAEPTSSSTDLITFSNVNSNNVTLTITNEKIQIRDVTITLADEGGSASDPTPGTAYNSDVNLSNLQVGDILCVDAVLNGSSDWTLKFVANRYMLKYGDDVLTSDLVFSYDNLAGSKFVHSAGEIVVNVGGDYNTYRPVDINGIIGDRWIVTAVGTNTISLAGYRITIPGDEEVVVIPTNTLQSSYTQGGVTITPEDAGYADYGFLLYSAASATITTSGTITKVELVPGSNKSYHESVNANGTDPTTSSEDLITFTNINSNEVILTADYVIYIEEVRVTIVGGGSTPTPTPSGSCGANVTWEFDPSTGALTITGTGAMDDYLNNASTPWNSYIADITSVTITDGVTNVGNHSFEQCTSLTTVTIGDDVETIGTFAFSECGDQFTTLTLGNSIRTIGNQAFASNHGITGFTLPSTLETIGNYAFIHNKAITTLTIPSNVTSIDVDAFYGCTAVTDVYCYPNAADLTWDDGDCDDFKSGKATICHVNADQLDAYQTKFNDLVRVTFVGDLDAPAPTPLGDKLPGVFSISSTETVNFSKGNLQYVGGNWQFADNQWDVIGASQADNNRDLFGWGTGNNPNQTSMQYGDYSTFADWGSNMGGDWRTLTRDEWLYIFDTRTSASALRGSATVCGVHGYIILPDNFVLPDGLSWTPRPDDWTTNVYTSQEWSSMEENGAVFLPVTGYRAGTTVIYDESSWGYYWSATEHSQAYNAYNVWVADEDDNVKVFYRSRTFGQSVRLVSETAPAPTNPVIKLYADFGGDWADTDAFTDNGNGTASWTISTLTAGEWYHFGVKVNDTWTSDNAAFDREHPSRAISGTGDAMWFQADVAGEYTFTWEYATNTLTIGFPDVVPTVAMKGSWDEWADVVNFSDNGNGTASATKTFEHEGYYTFKTVLGSDDWRGNGEAFKRDYTGAEGITENTDMTLWVDAKGEYTFTWTYASNRIDITYPALPTIYVNGEWDWEEKSPFTDNNNGTASFYIHLSTTGSNRAFKIRVGNDDWRSNGQTFNPENTTYDWINENNASDMKIYVDAEADYTFTWTYVENKLEITHPVVPDYPVTTKQDPVNLGVYYSTFYSSSTSYKLMNDGTEAFIAKISGGDLVLTQIAEGEQVIPKGTAVIFRKTGSSIPVGLRVTEENNTSFDPADNDLEGVDHNTEVTDIPGLTVDNCYVLSGESHDKSVKGVGFYKIYGSELKQHKAYVKYAGGQNNAPKKMRFVYGQATGIEDVQGNNVQSTKVIENGVLYIIRDGKTYNAMGQVVK